jgi:DNA-binding NarL/FixJ family response regulator
LTAASPSRTRVVIVDDQGMVRAGFRSLLEGEADLEVVGEAGNGEQAVEVVSRLAPDVTLMDIRMPVLDGIAATRRLLEAGSTTRVLVLTTFDLDEYVFEALRAGASGFLLKDAPAEELAAAIRVVAAGDSLLAPGVTRRVIDAFVRAAVPARPASSPRLASLTPRELEVLGLLAADCPTSTSLSGCTSPKAPPRPMSATSWPSSGCATGSRRWSSPTSTAWWWRGSGRPIGRTTESPLCPATESKSAAGRIRLRSRLDSLGARQRLRGDAMTVDAQRAAATSATAVTPAASIERRSTALSARRWFLIAAPVLAGLFAVVGAAADPAAGLNGNRLYELYAQNPEPLQLKSLGLHWSYAFWIAPALLIAPLVRGRGAWLANVTALVGFVGMTTLPGLLFVDWYDSAVGQVYGLEGNLAVNEVMTEMWGIPLFTVPGIVGFVLALPLTAITLWRASLVRWWALVAVLAGFAAFALSNVMWWGCVITTLCFAVFSVALHGATKRG